MARCLGIHEISKNNIIRSVRSVRLMQLMLERKMRIRMQPLYHTLHLRQPDVAPHHQETPDATPNTQDAT